MVVRAVETAADQRRFIDFVWEIYGDNPNWVPPLRVAVREMLDVAKHPFFRHAAMQTFLAYRDGRIAGRIAAIVDDDYNEFHREKTGFFGFFESVDDTAVAHALLDRAAAWLRERGMTQVMGPMNPSTNHECALLVEGFEDKPSIMLTYNPPYYIALLEGWGLGKARDMYAYEIDARVTKFSERLLNLSERLRQRGRITFRTVDMRRFDEEVAMLLDIYNNAWEKNWGFVPMRPEEFRKLASELKLILDPDFLLIAEIKGVPAGFGLAIPDANQAFAKVRDGRLFPFGWLRLFWHLKGPGRRKTIRRLRVITLGIKREFREAGIGPLLYTEYFKRGPSKGMPVGEASWILDNNLPMNHALEQMGAKRTKTYRVYEKALS